MTGTHAPNVLFDMDGTLLRLDVDIEEVRTRLGALFRPHGVTAPFRPILKRIRDAAAEAGARGADRSALERAGFAVLDEWEVRAAASARARAGAADVVSALALRGARLGVVTDNGRACVAPALRAAGLDPASFASIVTRDDVPAPKPDPAGVLRAAAALGAPLWYVGDHVKDVEAGRAAARSFEGGALRVAALRGGMSSDADLARAGADRILGELRDVLALD
jgi:HAD superfamily hydrolase (TIGR01549 family)